MAICRGRDKIESLGVGADSEGGTYWKPCLKTATKAGLCPAHHRQWKAWKKWRLDNITVRKSATKDVTDAE